MFRYVTDALKRRWDWLRRQVAIWVWDRPKLKHDSQPFSKRVVFIRWDAKLGDTIVLSWVFRELKRQRPDLQITVITAESFKELFVRGYGITSLYTASKRHGWGSLLRIARELARPEYVVHLSLKWRPRDIRFVRALSPRHVVGLDDDLNLVDIKLGELTRGRHFSEKLVPWLEQLGVNTTDRQYWIPRDAQARKQVDTWWPQGRVIGLCPYGASKKKYLDDDWISHVVTACLARDLLVVLLVLPMQRPHIEHLIELNGWVDRVTVNTGESSQWVLFEQVARCDALVSVDTAVVHLAVGLQKPLLAIYNSHGMEFENWHPNSLHASIVRTAEGKDLSVNVLDPNEVSLSLRAFFRSIRDQSAETSSFDLSDSAASVLKISK